MCEFISVYLTETPPEAASSELEMVMMATREMRFTEWPVLSFSMPGHTESTFYVYGNPGGPLTSNIPVRLMIRDALDEDLAMACISVLHQRYPRPSYAVVVTNGEGTLPRSRMIEAQGLPGEVHFVRPQEAPVATSSPDNPDTSDSESSSGQVSELVSEIVRSDELPETADE